MAPPAPTTIVFAVVGGGGAGAPPPHAAIALQLHVSTATVKTHLQHVYEKLEVSDRASAVAQAIRRGLLP
jgi:FixJ family two-component response regulator